MKLTKRLNQKIKILLLSGFLLLSLKSTGQSLEACRNWALENSAAWSQQKLQHEIGQLNKEQIKSQLLPQLLINGSASYQSEVFTLPFQIPGTDTPVIPKDQYNLSLNIQQTLYDGKATHRQQALATAESQLKTAQIGLKDDHLAQIIHELYFGILQLEAQLNIQEVLLDELDNRLKTARISEKQGLVLSSQIKQLEKERLKVIQNQTALTLKNQSLRTSLSNWTGQSLMEAQLTIPALNESLSTTINRQELEVFQQQQALVNLKSELTNSQRSPKLFAFGNLGLGQPNPLNFFETDWNGYYMVGAKLQWQLWDWGKTNKERESLSLQYQSITLEQDHFLQQIAQQQELIISEIRQLESQLTIDAQLVSLQEDILQSATMQLEEGTISHTDYLTELNQLAQLKTHQVNHEIQLAYQKINYLTLIGQL